MNTLVWLLIALAVLTLAAAGVAWLLDRRPDEPETVEALEVEWCDVCAKDIDGPRCKLVQRGEEPDGSGWAMVAYYHPACCPITDPAHHHAGVRA